MPRKEGRRLRVGVLGCGPINQFAHFESCAKTRDADLHASHAPEKTFADYHFGLADCDATAMARFLRRRINL